MQLDIHEILSHLPHRYPFVLIDRVSDLKLNDEITAIKNVTINEPFFPGHFPYHPVMPGFNSLCGAEFYRHLCNSKIVCHWWRW